MRKTAILIAGAIAFDLGVLIVAGYADTLHPIKSGKADVVVSPYSTGAGGGSGKVSMQDFHFTKIDDKSTPEMCMMHGGTVVRNSAGLKACQSKQVIPGAIEILAWSWGGASN